MKDSHAIHTICKRRQTATFAQNIKRVAVTLMRSQSH